VRNIPFYGFAAVCVDDPDVQEMVSEIENRRLIAYGLNPQAEVRAVDVTMGPAGARFDIRITGPDGEQGLLQGFSIPMAGAHNVLNALAAFAVGRELGVEVDHIRSGLAAFGGVRRRFTTTGVVGGVRIIDDYGHHPSVLAAARAITEGRVIAVVQPHRFTRLRDLFQEFCVCFNDADAVIVADVYPAGEAPIEGFDRDALAEGVRRHGHRQVMTANSPADLPALIAAEAAPGDLVVFLGAGDITAWANALPAQLEALAA
jgi:UDP-N-acetylmuramate--alanine ligase